MKPFKFLALLLALLCAFPAAAILPAEPAADDTIGETPAEPAIAQSQSDGDDSRIADRITGIFAELPGLQNVRVEVNEGVVALSGAVADAETIDRAENIAARVSGVVTVENSIERDLSVEQNFAIVDRTSGIFDRAIAALPLFAVAALTALVIAVLGYLIASLGFIWNRIAPNAFLGELIRSLIRFVFVVGGLVIALDMLGAVALLSAVLGGAGVVGIALGFAMRETIENYVASLMLSLRQPFRPNDHVVIDDLEGRVIRLTSRATVLMTLEGNHLRIPNSQVFKGVILNFTRNPQRRFQFELGIDADDDPREAMRLGRATLLDLPFILSEPEPAGRIEEVGDSNIVILFLGWIDQGKADWFKSRSLAIAAVKEALEVAGFALPEPIYRLRFDGRTDPLPIGRSADSGSGSKRSPPPSKPPPKSTGGSPRDVGVGEDVRPESEISEMVEVERRTDPEQVKDLLDPSQPRE